jgi:ketosteroid isomerase-like protein
MKAEIEAHGVCADVHGGRVRRRYAPGDIRWRALLAEASARRATADLLEQLAASAASGDSAAYWALHTDDFVCRIPGRSAVAGEWRGRPAMERLDELEHTLTDGTVSHEAHDSLASEGHAVILMRITARRGGRMLDAAVTYVFHVSDGMFSELWIHPHDLYAWDAFWAV